MLEWTMDTLRQDVAQVSRSLLKAPRFAAAVVLMLALGIGANSAIFSVVNAVMLQPLPFPHADRFVHLAWDGGGGLQEGLSPIKFEYWRENTRSFEGMATWRSFLGRLDEGDGVTGVTGLRVTRDFLGVLGFQPALGRDFTEAEDVPGGPDVVVISHRMWRARFGGATGAVGGTVRINERPYTVVGVLPADFRFPEVGSDVDAIVPMGLRADPKDEGANFATVARLKDGVTRRDAEADVHRLLEPFREAYPNQVYQNDRGMTLATFGELYLHGTSTALWMMMGAVTLVLLIACANVANLFLARGARRRGEVALRAALGATRTRVARFILTESVVLALAAGGLGLLLARWGVRALVALSPTRLPRMEDIGVDWRVVAFTFLASLVTGLVFGGAAAWPAARAQLSEVLKEGARGATGRGRGRQGLLVAQSALSMVLLVGAGLLLVTLIGLRRVDSGFDPGGVVAVRFPLAPAGYGTAHAMWELERRVAQEMSGTPAVASIAGASNLPLERGLNIPVSIGGRPELYEGAVEWRAVTPGYFETLGIQLTAGRTFSTTDEEGGPPVAIVNEAFVRRYFPDEDPIGQRVDIGRFRGEWIEKSLEGPGAEIVGVVADIREISLRTDPRRTVYVPAAQAPTQLAAWRSAVPVFLARIRPGRGDAEGVLRQGFRSIDPGLPSPEIIPLGRVVDESLARERFGATLLTTFAVLALALTALGIYGVLAYTVRRRRQEIGIRMALGAGGPAVSRMVALQGLAPVSVGLVVGAAASLALSRLLAGMVWGVSPTDPATISVVAGILLAVAVAASWLPAREAVRTDPVRSLDPE